MSRRKSNSETSTGARPGVTEDTFPIEATAYSQANGKCWMMGLRHDANVHGQPIEGAPHRRELGCWLKYFQLKRMRTREKWFKQALDRDGYYALPSQWPWQFDQSITELFMGEWQDYPLPGPRRVLEPVPEALAWLRDRNVDHLPTDHPERRKAMAAWASYAMRRPDLSRYAEGDPNRQGPPKGWARPGA